MKTFNLTLFTLFTATLNFNVNAAVIEVNSTGGGLGTSTLCSLRAAIRAAETDAPFSACQAGSGDDVIILPENETFLLNQIDNNSIGGNALPSILTTITIEGNGSILKRSETAPLMRFFSVNSNLQTNESGHLTLNNLTLLDGDVDDSGGAILNRGILELNFTRLENNQASFEGGALSCIGSGVQCIIKSSSFIGNSASYAGAIDVDLNAELVLEKSMVFGNEATINNGAVDVGSIYVESGYAFISNSTIANNQANRYGGLFADGDSSIPFGSVGRIEVFYSTIVNNSPIGLVGNIEIKNSIVSNNNQGNCRSVSSSVISLGYNHSDDLTCNLNSSGDVVGTDVMLSPLQITNQYVQSFPLNYESSAIDSADPNDCIDEDQLGQHRPQDGNNDAVLRCDKGAYEMVNNIIFTDDFE